MIFDHANLLWDMWFLFLYIIYDCNLSFTSLCFYFCLFLFCFLLKKLKHNATYYKMKLIWATCNVWVCRGRNAVDALGGTETLAQVGKEMKDLIKLQLRPGDPFAHPITGRRCDSKAIVLKVCIHFISTLISLLRILLWHFCTLTYPSVVYVVVSIPTVFILVLLAIIYFSSLIISDQTTGR